MNISDYNIGDDAAQSILMVGDSGTGKSIAAAYFKREQDNRNIYFASCDGRMASVAEWHRGRKDIEFDRFTNYDSLRKKVQELVTNCPYQTVIVDPITNISSFLLRYSFSLRGVTTIWNEDTGKVEKQEGSKGRKKGDIDLTTVEDYGVEFRGLEDLILDMKHIQENHNTTIILTAHLLTTQYTKVGGADSHIRRDIVTAGKKIVPFIPTQFDEYYHFYCEDGKYLIKTFNDGVVAARSSFVTMPKIIDWTNKDPFKKISAAYIKTEKKEGEQK